MGYGYIHRYSTPRHTLVCTLQFSLIWSNKYFPSLTCTYDYKCTQKLKENIQSELNLFDKCFLSNVHVLLLSVTKIQITKFLILLEDSIYCSFLLNLNVYIIVLNYSQHFFFKTTTCISIFITVLTQPKYNFFLVDDDLYILFISASSW